MNKRLSFQLLATLLTIMLLPQQAMAEDYMCNSNNFYMSSASDHLTFSILMADLYGRDTWLSSGHVKAYSNSNGTGTCYELVDVYTADQSNTDSHRIFGVVLQTGASAFITNGTGNTTLHNNTYGGYDNCPIWVPASNSYPRAEVDFYWSPKLAGRTWYFYLEGSISGYNSKSIKYYLGSANCPTMLGRQSLATKNYSCKRKNAKELEFTVPAGIAGIDKVSGRQWPVNTYEVTFIYSLYDGSKVTQRKTMDCSIGSSKTYTIAIPEEVGNFWNVDMEVKATDGYKCISGEYYYNYTYTYNKKELEPTVPTPTELVSEYHQFDKAIALVWKPYTTIGAITSKYIGETYPFIYRLTTDKNGKAKSGEAWTKVNQSPLAEVGTQGQMTYTDNSATLSANSYYKYRIVNIPNSWLVENNTKVKLDDKTTANLSELADSHLKLLGYIESDIISTQPSMNFFNFAQDESEKDKVKLKWQYTRVPVSANTVDFKVWRASKGSSEWTQLANGTVSATANPEADFFATFTDNDVSNQKARYDYKITLSINDGKNTFESDVITGGLLSGTSITQFDATKGTHEGTVNVQWKAKQRGTDNTNFDLYRRYVGDNGEWMKIHSTSGTSDSYTYEDNTVRPGYYYEYKVEAYSGEKEQDGTTISTKAGIGFCLARGVVSGRVTFGNSDTSVENVKVSLRSGDGSDENAVKGYSQRIDGASTGIVWQTDSATATNDIFGNDYTLQMYVRPDANLSNGVVAYIPGAGQLAISANTLLLGGTNTGITVPAGIFSLVTLIHADGSYTVTVGDATKTGLQPQAPTTFYPFSVGGASGVTSKNAFRGNITEVRIWNYQLTEKELTSYRDRSLSGRESGLKLYWPMDEGINRLVFDASYSNDMPNGRHATVGNNIVSSSIIPSEEQLSRYGITNASGEYTIRGIPFVGSGSSYTFTPSKGIHSFTPTSRNGFISASSLALNGYDFTDDSSFPLTGKVTYLNTNIPVDSVQFKIDGSFAQSKNGGVYSNSDGEYTVNVPIGNHRVEAWKDGHRLTAFPLEEGETYNFMQAEICNFTDSTLVNVTGRINGGYSDKDEPVGFARSKNRIGQATLKLSLGREAQSSFNYIVDDHGVGNFGTTSLPVESATEKIKSTAYRGAGTEGDNSNTKFIYITTDPATGEFSAMLPPLNYKVESITFPHDETGDNALYNNHALFTQNLPMINATTTNEKEMKFDSLNVEGQNAQIYRYSAKFVRQLRNEPVITVTQDDMQNGAFGMEKFKVSNDDNTTEEVVITSYSGDSYTYNYDYPLFKQNDTYNMTIKVSENYTNVDTKAVTREVPADAMVSVANEGSISTAVIAEKCTVGGKEMEVGEVYSVNAIDCTPDATGTVKYTWIAGYPNLSGKYLRNLTISAKVDGRTTMWKAPNSSSEALEMIILGGIITGTNFVTAGPDHVDMIIRRPPGSTGNASYATDSVTTTANVTTTYDSHSGGGGVNVSISPKFKSAEGAVFFWVVTEIDVKAEHKVTRDNISEDSKTIKSQQSYAVSETMKTPSSDTYTQRDGDTFIGRATNLLFGKGRAVKLAKQQNGTYRIEQQDAICTGETFGTTFIYPHQYIEDVLLPNWRAMIDNFLVHWDGDLSQAPKVPGKKMYYTNYNKGDREWGVANSDEDFWTREVIDAHGGMPGYRIVNGLEGDALENATDSVEWCVNQIKCWQYWLGENEKDKLDAFNNNATYFDKNYSIAGGTSVNHSTKNNKTKGTTNSLKSAVSVNNETTAGVLFNNVGACALLKFNDSWGTTTSTGDETSTSHSFNWTISDAEPTTALSVDVYESPKGWGPIFRTRGGQSSNPYEGATYTRYYAKGTKLDEATMRVEKPELRVDGASKITDVPSGTKAKFNLQLINASETGTICNYVLECVERSNPHGAIVEIDGEQISNGRLGRSIKMKPDELVNKVVMISQSDRTINDYENIELVLKSAKDTSTVSTPVRLSAYFVPASASVDMAVNRTTLNQNDYKQNGGFRVTLTNLNRQDEGLEGVRVQYRRRGLNSWSLAKEWRVKKEGATIPEGATELPEGAQFSTAVAFPEDGVYELRTQTFGMYGQSEVTFETPVVEVTQDLRGPKILGSPYPEGIANYTDRNNISLRFNEAFNVEGLSKSDNFIIEGNLNNAISNGNKVTNPDVALQLEGEEIKTQASYSFDNTDIAIDAWVCRKTDGTLLSLGTEDNLFALYTVDGRICARVGEENHTFDTGVELPADKWLYLAMSYKRGTPYGTINAIYSDADHDRPITIVKDKPVGKLRGQGQLTVGGDGMKGMMRDLTLWNIPKAVDELYEGREELKAAYTPGLVGYWRMDEGHGTTLIDKARSRHMEMPTESWYINNRNLAVQLSKDEAMKVNLSTFAPRTTDNFAVELWFRGDKDVAGNQNATLMEVPGCMSADFEDGKLTLNTYERTATGSTETVKTKLSTVLSDVNYIDNNWHHFALNVRRGTSAIAYIDGEAVKTMPEAAIPAPAGAVFQIGKGYTGGIDDIRIWNAALTGKTIADSRYERLDANYSGLIGYFPFESIHRLPSGTVTTEFSIENFGNTDVTNLTASGVTVDNLSKTAPALLPGSQRMRLDESEYEFTASNNEIYFSFPDKMLARMDGNDFTISVQNIKDVHGNTSEPVEWSFTCNWSTLDWFLEESTIVKDYNEDFVVRGYIFSESNSEEEYEFVNLPSWLTVDEPIGKVGSDFKTVNFHISSSVPVGHYNEYIYLNDMLGIKRPCKLSLTVRGDEPDWKVDVADYEKNMTVTGQIYIKDKILEYEDSRLGAFNKKDECIGIARPEYVASRDAYYVNMVIYGNPQNGENGNPDYVTFKLYDSSTGITYPVVSLDKDDAQLDVVEDVKLAFTPDANFGSYDAPIAFRTANYILQTKQLNAGWNWMAINLNPLDDGISAVLPAGDELASFNTIKGHDSFSSVLQGEAYTIRGELTNIKPGKMYKVRMNHSYALEIIGESIDVSKTTQTINPGWNWIGSLSGSVMSPDIAFAELEPQKGDRVKSRTSFSEYNGFMWEGKLQEINPGEGYIYYSKAAAAKEFHYPVVNTSTANARSFADRDNQLTSVATHYQVENINRYPDNMAILATIVRDTELIGDAELAAFIDGECRGAVKGDGIYYFLTILGTAAEDQGKKIELRVWHDGREEVLPDQGYTFISDANYGSFDDSPVLLELEKPEMVLVPGDIDKTGYVNFKDFDLLADALTNSTEPDSADPDFFLYDANSDLAVNVADLQAIVNLYTGLNADGSEKERSNVRQTADTTEPGMLSVAVIHDRIGVNHLAFNLDSRDDYRALQMDLILPLGMTVSNHQANGMTVMSRQLTATRHRIVAYGRMENGTVLGIDLNGDGSIVFENVVFATADARAVLFNLGGTTGINTLTDSLTDSNFYDLTGRQKKNIGKGVNIIRQSNGSVKKVFK